MGGTINAAYEEVNIISRFSTQIAALALLICVIRSFDWNILRCRDTHNG